MTKNEEKLAVRKKILQKRVILKKEEIEISSKKIIEKLKRMNCFKNAKKILIYYPIKNEVNILPILKTKNKDFFLPKIINNEIKIAKIKNDTIFISGKYNIPEPKDNIVDINPDLIIIPGIAFDLEKNRIGYGKGYYDEYLRKSENNCKKIAIAYDFQIMKNIPSEIFDIKCDKIVSEKKVYK